MMLLSITNTPSTTHGYCICFNELLFSSVARCSLCAIFNCNWKRKASKNNHAIVDCNLKRKASKRMTSKEWWAVGAHLLEPAQIACAQWSNNTKKQKPRICQRLVQQWGTFIYTITAMSKLHGSSSPSCVCMERRSSRLFWHKPEWRTKNAANDLNLCILICYSGWWSKHCSRQKREQSEDPSSVQRLGTWLQIPM